MRLLKHRPSVVYTRMAELPSPRSNEAGTIPRLFAEQARRTPDAPALFFGAESISYSELAARADAFAHALIERFQIGPDDRVLVCLERGPDAVAALLGILKTGAAYVPVDPSFPSKRIVSVLADADPSAVICSEELLRTLPDSTLPLWLDPATVPVSSPSPVADRSEPDGVAYLIHTSGSTGQPKGVEGLHRGAINRFRWMWREYPFANGEVGCIKTTISFVDSVWEIFGPLLRGMPSLLLPAEIAADPRALLEQAARSRVSRIVLVPSLLRVLLETLESDATLAWPSLRLCVSSGEALPVELVPRFRARFPLAKLLNLYGSSEVSADVTCFDTDELATDHATVPLGKPIDRTRIHLLDESLKPVADGGEGEICVAGENLARGYFRQAARTVAAFVTVPLPEGRRERLYRTGDLGRLRPDGNLEFLGRLDHQIKLRGVRIEPGDIESALVAHPTVAQARVRLVRKPEGDRLFAYVTAAPGAEAQPGALMERLAAHLPAPMLPHHIVTLAAWPLTVSGKIDLQSLPTDVPSSEPREDASTEPFSETETRLAALWAEILGVAPGRRDAHFLESGGDSLGLMTLSASIRKTFGRYVPMGRLLESPTLSDLASAIGEAANEADWSSLVPLREEGSKHPLFLVHGLGGGILWGYRNLVEHLDPARPVYAFSSRGLDGLDEFDTPVAMAAQYLRDLKTVQPVGPYLVGGYCFGGNIAYEMCRQLREQGEKVALCLVIDAYPFLHSESGRKLKLRSPAEGLRFGFNFATKAWHLLRMPARERRGHIARIGRWLRWRFSPATTRSSRGPGLDDNLAQAEQEAATLTNLENYSEAQARLWTAHVALHDGWIDAPPTGGPLPLALLRTRSQPVFSDYARDFGWSKLTGTPTRLARLSGHHDFVFLPPHVRAHAAAVDAILHELP